MLLAELTVSPLVRTPLALVAVKTFPEDPNVVLIPQLKVSALVVVVAIEVETHGNIATVAAIASAMSRFFLWGFFILCFLFRGGLLLNCLYWSLIVFVE